MFLLFQKQVTHGGSTASKNGTILNTCRWACESVVVRASPSLSRARTFLYGFRCHTSARNLFLAGPRSPSKMYNKIRRTGSWKHSNAALIRNGFNPLEYCLEKTPSRRPRFQNILIVLVAFDGHDGGVGGPNEADEAADILLVDGHCTRIYRCLGNLGARARGGCRLRSRVAAAARPFFKQLIQSLWVL
jgi:hypothetical protein